jgi:hypothetical protein
MKRWTLIAALVPLCVVGALMPGASAQTAQRGTMRVMGHATVEVVPDYAVVTAGVSTKAKTPTAALDQNSATARKIIEFTKQFGVDERDIRTQAVTLNPSFRQVRDPSGGSRQEPDGYTASNSVQVKLTELARVGAFMREVLDQGATNIRGVQFGASKIEQVTDDARTKAVENAFHKAQSLAAAAKVRLGAIEEIAYPPRAQAPSPGAVFARGAAPSAVPIEAGTLKISESVEITWAIE